MDGYRDTGILSDLMLVQFPHRGTEHQPRGRVTKRNRHDHARKFLEANGRHIADGGVQSGVFAFWDEWEPQSRVVETFRAEGARPRSLHEPFWWRPTDRLDKSHRRDERERLTTVLESPINVWWRPLSRGSRKTS